MIGNNLTLSFGLNVIYDHANFLVQDNQKVGIVGVNGCGKTTLFKVILKEIELNEGTITYNGLIGYLPQTIELESQEMNVLDYLLSARPIAKIEQEISLLYEKVILIASEKEKDRILKKIGKLETMLDYYERYTAENTLMEIVENMQIQSELLDLKLKNLSGGQKSKIAFAALLYSKANILLLDEPTNHLDNSTRQYVIDYLKNYQGMVFIISHDIEFLNAIVTKIMHIDKSTHKINVYDGNYDKYIKVSTSLLENQETLLKNQEKEIKKLRDFVLLYSNSSGKRKRIAESREKLLAKKEKELVKIPPSLKKINMHYTNVESGSKIPLQVNNLTFGYDKLLYKDLSFTINDKEKFLILGENGVGKSTLLKLIIGQLEPENGSISLGIKNKIAYYAQEQENLDLEKTVYENMVAPEYSSKQIYGVLGDFLFTENEFDKKVKYLSPGERARINLAKIRLSNANLLILDEPTNHLDPITQELVAKNFKEYNGTLILVSHNLNFVNNIGINRILLLPSGKIVNYYQDIVEFYSKANVQ